MLRKITINIDSFKLVSLLDKRPDQRTDDCVTQTEQPTLRPVQVHMRSPNRNAKCISVSIPICLYSNVCLRLIAMTRLFRQCVTPKYLP